jgi:hypothetical protein
MYTFGSPRVGNSFFSFLVNQIIPSYIRVVHCNDVVPHVPIKVLGYKHAGVEVWY